MSYIDAVLDSNADKIYVVERTPEGKRAFKEHNTNYVFYYEDPKGKFRSIFDTPVARFSSRNNKEFRKELRMHTGKQIFESDINPVFRCLAENFLGADAPKLHTAFFDIETDFDQVRGFSSTEEAFNKITAITLLTPTK